ncbi:hypothetical protein B0T14DRAFT_567022 [Immersiella caudata]|uniref:Major facilitator superfamily (MFS) profile domain-containing protein n=1 Tax=Immersiella caudata TaxID=314043 RepID=A0AA40BZY8_9PEZI|nr:hypothetical protein B0T14DRAFT_567022 [Immersiella caudata]
MGCRDTENSSKRRAVTRSQQTGKPDSTTVWGAFASVCGAIFNGWAAAHIGHRIVPMGSLAFLTGATFISFFASSIEILLLGQFLCGLSWGVFTMIGLSYAAEVSPFAICGYLTAYVNLCWCIGQFISAGVLKGLISNLTEWG